MKKTIKILISVIPLLTALLYGSGMAAQFFRNYSVWQRGGGVMGGESGPKFPSIAIHEVLTALFSYPYGLIGLGICAAAFGI